MVKRFEGSKGLWSQNSEC